MPNRNALDPAFFGNRTAIDRYEGLLPPRAFARGNSVARAMSLPDPGFALKNHRE